MTKISKLLDTYPGKGLGALRLPVDFMLLKAGIGAQAVDLALQGQVTEGFNAISQHGNPYLAFVGLIGITSSAVLFAFTDRSAKNGQTPDPQDESLKFREFKPWKFPWEYNARIGQIKAAGLMASAVMAGRIDDGILAATIIAGQQVTRRVPEAKPGTLAPATTKREAVANWVKERPNRASAHIMNIGNIAFTVGGIVSGDVSRIFAGAYSTGLNAVLMTRASKRYRQSAPQPAALPK